MRKRVGELGDSLEGLIRKERLRRAEMRAELLCWLMAVSSSETPLEGAITRHGLWCGVVIENREAARVYFRSCRPS